MRRGLIFVVILLITGLVLFLTIQYDASVPNELAGYYAQFAYQETGALNAVTAVYLNYRVYDTLFEALMLLISILAIIYFSRHDEYEYEL